MIPASKIVNVTLTLQGGNIGNTVDFGSLCGCFVHAEPAEFAGPFSSLAEVQAAFDATTYPEITAWATAVFAQGVFPAKVYIGRLDGVTLMATQLASIQAAALAANADFLFFTIESRDAIDLDSAAGWAEASGWEYPKIFLAQTSDADVLTSTPGNIADVLALAAYKRTSLLWHTGDGDYCDGSEGSYLGGVAWDSTGGAGQLTFATLPGIPADTTLTGAQYQAVENQAANVYASFGGNVGVYPGVSSAGTNLAITISTIWVVARVREAVLFTLFNSSPKIPYTDAGISRIATAAENVLTRGVSIGHIAPYTEATPYGIVAPAVRDVSPADKASGTLNLTGSFYLAGSITRVNIVLKAVI